MPAIITNARSFLKNSDYPYDKVVGMMSGQINAVYGAFDPPTDIPHGLPFTPLAVTTYSTSPTFETSRDEGIQIYGDPSTMVNVTSSTDATNLRIRAVNNLSGTRTLYWRTFLLAPPGTEAEAPFTAAQSTDFNLNTDQNYAKLFKSDVVSSNTTITHDLGYMPQVMIWVGDAFGTTRLTFADSAGTGSVRVTITDSSVQIDTSVQTFYRIYLDD